MAQKITDFFYRISPTEDITFTISGQADPHVFLDNLTLNVAQGVPFTITPKMLSGMGAVHFMTCVLMFLAGPGSYFFDVADTGGSINQFTFTGPNQQNFSEATITIQVV